MPNDNFLKLKVKLNNIIRKGIAFNINQLINIINFHQVDHNMVVFHPIFSLDNKNNLINEVIIDQKYINVHINIHKIRLFNKNLIDIYHIAKKKEQDRIINIINRAYSTFMHHYFFSINTDIKLTYFHHETLTNSIAVLCQYLKNILAEFHCFFSITTKNVNEINKKNIIGKNSIINFSNLTGSILEKKIFIKIDIKLNFFNQKVIQKIEEKIQSSHFISKYKNHIGISLKFIYNDSASSNKLHKMKIGESILNRYTKKYNVKNKNLT
ncbi:type VI secretion system baseplate protein IglJ [uncultured Shewanella sp.]|uniref:type VI secretion system baseplate protein IglJ n=1 Tax=uncultured Shewanella sp. TaxID=173975 RepID=UPI002605D236|nr:type VI secretion system baseplate protein IglJ [uncultured Shewanella sp.]